MDNSEDDVRIIVLTILIAIVFGIKNHSTKISMPSFAIVPQIVVSVFMSFGLFLLLLYVLSLGLSKGYHIKKRWKRGFFVLSRSLYDVVLVLITVILIVTLAIYFGITIMPLFNNDHCALHLSFSLGLIVAILFSLEMLDFRTKRKL